MDLIYFFHFFFFCFRSVGSPWLNIIYIKNTLDLYNSISFSINRSRRGDTVCINRDLGVYLEMVSRITQSGEFEHLFSWFSNLIVTDLSRICAHGARESIDCFNEISYTHTRMREKRDENQIRVDWESLTWVSILLEPSDNISIKCTTPRCVRVSALDVSSAIDADSVLDPDNNINVEAIELM